jgi:hypothetical protein
MSSEEIMNKDEIEDELDLKNPGLKKQIRESHQDYLAGKARDAGEFLAELRRTTAKTKKSNLESSRDSALRLNPHLNAAA